MTHFDAALDHQRTLAVRAWIASNHVTDICHFWGRHITIPVDAEVVLAVDVGARREVAHHGNGTVDNHRDRHVHRAEGARTGVDDSADLSFGSEGQRAGNLRQLLCFHFVQLMIATHQQGDQRISTALYRFYQQGLNGLLNWQVKLLNQLGDGFRVRRIDQGHLLSGRRARFFRCQRFGKLDVGRVVRAVGEDHVIFTALGQHLELVRGAAADRAGIRLHGTEVEIHAAEDFAVGSIHRVVGQLQGFL